MTWGQGRGRPSFLGIAGEEAEATEGRRVEATPILGPCATPSGRRSAVTLELTSPALGSASPGLPLCLLPQGWGHLRTPEPAQETSAEEERGGWRPHGTGHSRIPIQTPAAAAHPHHQFPHPPGGSRLRWGSVPRRVLAEVGGLCPQEGPG